MADSHEQIEPAPDEADKLAVDEVRAHRTSTDSAVVTHAVIDTNVVVERGVEPRR
jgi:hypothetical protein